MTDKAKEPLPDFEETLRAEVVLGQWTRVLFQGLVAAGVREAVICPGSRSTPLVIAALAQKGLRCHSVLDERSAAFFALGLAQASGRPPLLICTSGSAAGHFLPAAMEATSAALPLLILTADRPSELQGCGAPQTLSQVGMFGVFARSSPPLGEPAASLDKLAALYRKAAQAVHSSLSPSAGAVHLNFPVAKPLRPAAPTSPTELRLEDEVSTLLSEKPPLFVPGGLLPHSRERQRFLEWVSAEDTRTLVVMGPMPSAQAAVVRDFAAALEVPCVSELPQAGAAAPLEFLPTLFAARPELAPARILHVGVPCVSASWNRYLKSTPAELCVLPGEKHRDPSQRASKLLLGQLDELLGLLVKELPSLASSTQARRTYRDNFASECDGLVRAIRLGAPREPGGDGHKESKALPELAAVSQVITSLAVDTELVIANSLTLRLVSWSGAAADGVANLFTGRGTNGIDGWIARATGVAVSTGQPTALLLGDVSAAHDLCSLALARRAATPLLLIVLDNGGGRIFDHLPLKKEASTTEEDWDFWITPPEINWQAAAATYGIAFRTAKSEVDIKTAMQQAYAKPGASLMVIPTDSTSTGPFLEAMRKKVTVAG